VWPDLPFLIFKVLLGQPAYGLARLDTVLPALNRGVSMEVHLGIKILGFLTRPPRR
jgi:hypothetical protein